MNWHQLSDQAKIALIDISYNLGDAGFAGFQRMIAALNSDLPAHPVDVACAAFELIDSDRTEQTGEGGVLYRRSISNFLLLVSGFEDEL